MEHTIRIKEYEVHVEAREYNGKVEYTPFFYKDSKHVPVDEVPTDIKDKAYLQLIKLEKSKVGIKWI